MLTPEVLLTHLNLLPKSKAYWVAYSGGCDSHVLLHLLAQLYTRALIPEPKALHINHGLNEQADAWAEHCLKTCNELGLECEAHNVKVENIKQYGLEAAARIARYAVFENILGKDESLLLAHHQDDQAETFLLQALRGAGPKGLSAMPVYKRFGGGYLARPLLSFSRSEITAWAQKKHLHWIEDPSNSDTVIERNYLRHHVMPLLEKRWPAGHKTLTRAASHQAEATHLLQELAVADYLMCGDEDQCLAISALVKLSRARQINLLRYWLRDIHELAIPDSRQLRRILNEVVAAKVDATPLLNWAGGEVRRYQSRLYAARPRSLIPYDRAIAWDLAQPLKLKGGFLLVSKPVVGGGLKLADGQLKTVQVGFRRGGERCRPRGHAHHKKLKNLFQQWQVPPWLRDSVPLIYVDEQLAQVVGHCVCEPFVATGAEAGIHIEKKLA